MGAKDSKPSFLTYEEALKRVSETELKRLKDAFKRSSTLSGYMTKPVFIREVLGDGVPPRLAEQMYVAFGGTAKGLALKDLVCGLVLLTRGRQEEKVKFLFGLYANELLIHVQKEEMDQLVLATEGHVPHALSDLFRDTDRVTYEAFRGWVLCHVEATSVTRWLLQEPCTVTLYNNLETPTFYQTLAGVTHLEETDIIELEKRYWTLKAQSKTGRFDVDTFRPIVCPPIPDALCEGVFFAFDENRDNHIDFKEMACGISACCRGPLAERQKFCFKIFDADHDGLLSRCELQAMVSAMMAVRKETQPQEEQAEDELTDVDPAKLADEILKKHDSDMDGKLSQEDFLVWTVSHALPDIFLQLLFQVCHVVLGLKPQNKEDEATIISGWLEREERRGLITGTTWYLVSMPWWRQWQEYVNLKPVQVDLAEEIMPPDGMLTNGRLTDRKGAPRAATLCRTFNRKSSIGLEEGGLVVGTSYQPAGTDGAGSVTASPTKFSSLPRTGSSASTSSLTASPHSSPAHRNNLSVASDVNASPSHSRNGSPSPCPSPKLNKRVIAQLAQRPGAIDNTQLILTNTSKVMTLTNEGGRLKRDKMLARCRDFELLPEPVWRALSGWYGGSPALPRTVITPSRGDHTPELELYPITVRLLRHQNPTQRPNQVSSFTGMIGGMGGMAVMSYADRLNEILPSAWTRAVFGPGTAGLTQSQPPTPRRYLAYLAAFSRKHTLRQVYEFLNTRLRINRDDMRLWKFKDEHNMTLLEEEELTMEQLVIEDNQQLLIEVRNKDLTWPEEMSQLAKNKAAMDKKQVHTERGATGLNNLGNTCFMNSALQCVSNTRILTLYFNGGMHLYEINRTNPLGMKGHIAQRYGELVKDLWSGTAKSIAPLKLRWTIGKYAPRFNGFQQHDSQELLAFLLDGLHEDLNRVHDKPYVELKDSDGRPDGEVAKEAWENHILRNRSVVVDLFHGQLKSCVRCLECGHTSVRFDPFTYLSLPLPMDSCIHVEIIVVRMDGSIPVKYGLRLNMDEKYKTLKRQLSELCSIQVNQLLLAEISGALLKSLPQDMAKIKSLLGGSLYAYEMPPTPEISPMSAVEERDYQLTVRGNGNDLMASRVQMDLTRAPQGVSEAPPSPRVSADLSQIQRRHLQATSKPRDPLPAVEQSNGPVSGPSEVRTTNSAQSSPSLQRAALTNGPSNGNSGPVVNGLPNGSPAGIGSPSQVMKHNYGHQRNTSSTSSSSASTTGTVNNNNNNGASLDSFHGFIVAVHRKMIRMDVYFLSSQKSRPSLFGTPLLLPCDDAMTTQDVYSQVWSQVSRLVSPLPPSEAVTPNHAQDCDDSMGYEYPFTLKVVQKDGFTCAWCPWYRFCRGCKLECNSELYNYRSCYIAVDWEPTALHLRYQTSQERMYAEHVSVAESRRLQTEPIDLDTCLKAFTKEEELGEDELYYCSKCKTHRLAAKKLEIWRLPPILIIHLKRFQFMNGRWVKSQKIVKFPVNKFDPTNYIVSRDSATSGSAITDPTVSFTPMSLAEKLKNSNAATNHNTTTEHHQSTSQRAEGDKPGPVMNGAAIAIKDTVTPGGDGENIKPWSSTTGVGGNEDGQNDLTDQSIYTEEDYKDVRYDLYALSCHTGILGGGHYVSYTKNPNDKWYCYNDSSCKEIQNNIDTDSAYILFYERKPLDYNKFMPDIRGKEPDTTEIDDEFESDFKKMCVLQ